MRFLINNIPFSVIKINLKKYYNSGIEFPLTNKLCTIPIFLSPLCSVRIVANKSPTIKCASVPFSINSD